MKTIRRTICLILCLALLMTAFGCKVNQDKLDEKVVAKVGDKAVLKKDLDKMTAVNLMYYYASYGQQILPQDEYADEIRQQITDEMVNTKLILYTAKKYKYKISWKKANRSASSMVKTIKNSSYIKKDGLDKVLADYGFKNVKELEEAAKLYARNSVYQSDFQDYFLKKTQGGKSSKAGYMKVADVKVPSYVYYYCLIQKTMEQTYTDYQKQYTQGSEEDTDEKTDEEKKEEVKKAAEEMVKEKASFMQAGNEGKVKASKKEINNRKAQNEYLDAIFGSLDSVYRTYGITKKQYSEAGKWVAKADVFSQKLQDRVKYDKATESDAKSEFEKNKKDYDTSTVSAKHILTSDKELANEIAKEAKKDGVKFDSVMARYQADSRVTEASDLGAFTYSTMVEEFSKAAFGAKKGEVTGPVKTDYGYHVIYVYAKKEVEPSFEKNKKAIMSSLNAERKKEAAEKLVEEIKKKYTATVLIQDIDEPYTMLIEKLKKEHPVKIYKSVMNKVVTAQ